MSAPGLSPAERAAFEKLLRAYGKTEYGRDLRRLLSVIDDLETENRKLKGGNDESRGDPVP